MLLETELLNAIELLPLDAELLKVKELLLVAEANEDVEENDEAELEDPDRSVEFGLSPHFFKLETTVFVACTQNGFLF